MATARSGSRGRHARPRGGRHAAPRQRRSTRSRLATGGVLALVAVGGVGTAAGPTLGAPPARDTSAAAPVSLGTGGGTTSLGMVRATADRLSRDSARQALADARGEDPGTPRSAETTQTNPGLKKLAASAEKIAQQQVEEAWGLPLAPGSYRLTARFGECSGLWAHCHTGLDFAAPTGTPITAVANGTVTGAGWAGAYGNRTVTTLPDGTELWYCHQSEIGVRPGQRVVVGQVIGRVGATGNVTGPHVHLEVRPGGGDPVDPEAALLARGVRP